MSDPTMFQMVHSSPETEALCALPWLDHAVWFGDWGLIVLDEEVTARISFIAGDKALENYGSTRYPKGRAYDGLQVDVVNLRHGPILSAPFLFRHFIDPAFAERVPRLIAGGDGGRPVVAWFDRNGQRIDPALFLQQCCVAIRDFLNLIRDAALPGDHAGARVGGHQTGTYRRMHTTGTRGGAEGEEPLVIAP